MQAMGHQIYATTTNEEKYHRLQGDGIFVLRANFDGAWSAEDFPKEVDYVLNSIPATRRLTTDDLENRFQQVSRLLSEINYKKQLFLSSIGVYPDVDGVFEEGDEVPEGNLLRAEQIMQAFENTVVYRLGGLFGGERIFAKYFAGRVCKTGSQPANFIHRDDVIELIRLGFEGELSDTLYNIVCLAHPTKKEVILASAAKHGFDLPAAFEDRDSYQKEVRGDKIVQELNFVFKYPSPVDF